MTDPADDIVDSVEPRSQPTLEALAVLAQIAQMLMIVQGVEGLVRHVVTYVIQDPGKPLNMDRIRQLEPELARKSLGQLFEILESRADLHPEFKGIIERFLADRNILAHDLSRVGGSKLNTQEGRDEMHRFLGRLMQTCDKTMRVFTSLVLSHARQLDQPYLSELDPKIEEFIGNFRGIEGNTFFVKYSQRWRRGKRGEILSEQPDDVWEG